MLERDEREPAGADEREPQDGDKPAENETLDAALAREDFSKAEDMDAGHDDMYVDSARADAPEPAQPLIRLDHAQIRLRARKARRFARRLAGRSADAEGSSGRPAVDRRPRRRGAHHRRGHHRFDRRGGLFPRRTGGDGRAAGRAVRPMSNVCLASCRASTPPASARATWPNAWRCNCANWTASIRRCRRCWPISIWSPAATWPGSAAHCGVDAEDVADMIAEIRALTPKPGLTFGSDPVQPVVPDVFVREGPDGLWHVELNSRDAAAPARQFALLHQGRRPGARQGFEGISERVSEQRQLACQKPGPARAHDPQGVERNRAPAGRISDIMACGICGRSICAPSPMRSRCTN